MLPARRTLVPAIVLLCLTGCGESSGCDDFHPSSRALPLGATQTVDATVHQGRLDSVDVNGGYYVHPQRLVASADGATVPDPRLPLPDGAVRIQVSHESRGLVALVAGERVALEGPIGCD